MLFFLLLLMYIIFVIYEMLHIQHLTLVGVALVWVDISIQEAPGMGPLSLMKTKDM